MTTLLQQAIAAAEALPAADQDAIAARLLAEIEDDLAWDRKFRTTTDAEWDQVAAEVRQAAADGRVRPLDDLVPSCDAANEALRSVIGGDQARQHEIRRHGLL